ncbi:TauA ABC-type nitrate/sulfonate/bicarbonate transport systems, periplasmic components [Rhabdaerophilaceae bacterium]
MIRPTKSRDVVRLGFMPLLDAAIPIVAAELGFAEKYGFDIELVRESSWANIRDRLAIGHFEAAHALAPMPIAAAMGLTPFDTPLLTPMVLGLGGNAITVSDTLWQTMHSAAPVAAVNDPAEMGAALRHAVRQRAEAGGQPLVFAVVHPFSSHNYELRYWLAASGINPDHDLRIAIVPPPFMPDALASGRIDGFCVGEPWNSRAARTAGGHIILTKSVIWSQSPEKVLALNAGWAEMSLERAQRLLMAMLEAASWCAEPGNRAQLAALMGRKDRLDVPVVDLHPALDGCIHLADGTVRHLPDFMIVGRDQAHMPWLDPVLWYATQMERWGQVKLSWAMIERVLACHRPDLYRKAASALGQNCPIVDFKPGGADGSTIEVFGFDGPIRLDATQLFDGRPFDAQDFLKHHQAAEC